MPVAHVLGYINEIADEAANDNVGTAGTNLTAKEEQQGSFHKTTLLIGSGGFNMPAIAGTGNAVGYQVYTFPAGKEILIKGAYFSLVATNGTLTNLPQLALGVANANGITINDFAASDLYDSITEEEPTAAALNTGAQALAVTKSAASDQDQSAQAGVFLNMAGGGAVWSADTEVIAVSAHDNSTDGIIVIEWSVLA